MTGSREMAEQQRDAMDGYWLPRAVRERLITRDTKWDSLFFADGRECEPHAAGAIGARWPRLSRAQWSQLLTALAAGRRRAPRGREAWARFQAALRSVGGRLADPTDPLHVHAVQTLPSYTGYSEAMIRFALAAPEMWAMDQMDAALRLDVTWEAARRWQPLPGLSGRLRFFPAESRARVSGRLRRSANRALYESAAAPALVAGYGAGNVPGTALLIVLLAVATSLTGEAPPAVVVRNSRREPIFSPLVLAALEEADPELVSTLAVLVWDYDDADLQGVVLSEADLVIAAASDETIARIGAQIAGTGRDVRFHAHGHKASFTAVGREVLARRAPAGGGAPSSAGGPSPRRVGEKRSPAEGELSLDAVALLAALDSAFWDQNGCLSSRIHFVERGGDADHTPTDYAESLARQLRLLAGSLPRGAWPRRHLHDRFDGYKALEAGGHVRVLTAYDDDFVVVLDERPRTGPSRDALAFATMVNDCQGRVVIVRAVDDLMDVPERYLRLLPAAGLQSLSVAVGSPGEGLSGRCLRFAEACGKRGVTAVRTVGRGAFPQLAYSWDGLLPADLVRRRPPGYFTTIEFDAPYEAMDQTYRLLRASGQAAPRD